MVGGLFQIETNAAVLTVKTASSALIFCVESIKIE